MEVKLFNKILLITENKFTGIYPMDKVMIYADDDTLYISPLPSFAQMREFAIKDMKLTINGKVENFGTMQNAVNLIFKDYSK